jgi:uncharacterized protein YecE (DUF72 family)
MAEWIRCQVGVDSFPAGRDSLGKPYLLCRSFVAAGNPENNLSISALIGQCRFPTASTVEAWAQQVPESFRFVLKAHQTITHFRRLRNAEEQIEDFIEIAAVLGKRRGPLLFQLPPNFKKDVPRLEAFLHYVDGRAAVVLQFQHDSWFDDEVYRCLRSHSAALCCADDEGPACNQVIATTRWGYVRLREERYTAARLKKWIEKLKAQDWRECFVFFKHEDVGAGPTLASRFLELASD